MSDPKTTQERISHAMVSGNLKSSANGIGDAEYLTAVGMAAMRVHPAASPALRLHLAQDASSYKELRREVIKETGRLNFRERWNFINDQVRTVADAALRHFIVPVCDKCLGLKYERITGTPMLSERVCRVCHGSGERPVMEKYRRQIAGVLNWLGRVEDDLVQAVRGKTRLAFA